MNDILNTIAAHTYERVAERKKQRTLREMMKEAESLCDSDPTVTCNADAPFDPAIPFNKAFPFERALKGNDIAFICEVKKASPSKGIIDEAFPYLEIAREYEKAGASAISVLTEPDWFLGSDKYLKEIRKEVKIPILRKDFTVDPYQIYEAKLIGADAVLLICALLDEARLKEYITIAHGLGLSALVEAHTEIEVQMALAAEARVIGVNNRNLKTFEVDINTSVKLRDLVPRHIPFVSESGISTAEDVARLRDNKVNGVLIGESFMRSKNKKERLAELRGASQ